MSKEHMQELVDFKELLPIYEICFKIQNKGIATVFVDVCAHTSKLNIRMHYGGWTANRRTDKDFDLYISKEDYEQERRDDLLEELREIYETRPDYRELEEQREAEQEQKEREQYLKLKEKYGYE